MYNAIAHHPPTNAQTILSWQPQSRENPETTAPEKSEIAPWPALIYILSMMLYNIVYFISHFGPFALAMLLPSF